LSSFIPAARHRDIGGGLRDLVEGDLREDVEGHDPKLEDSDQGAMALKPPAPVL
jgi:hypothetical protein